MTKSEYNELKYKLKTRQNGHYMSGLLIILVGVAPVSFGVWLLKPIPHIASYLLAFLITFLIGLMLTYLCDMWTERIGKLDELYKDKISYDEAFRMLSLEYEPPKE